MGVGTDVLSTLDLSALSSHVALMENKKKAPRHIVKYKRGC